MDNIKSIEIIFPNNSRTLKVYIPENYDRVSIDGDYIHLYRISNEELIVSRTIKCSNYIINYVQPTT